MPTVSQSCSRGRNRANSAGFYAPATELRIMTEATERVAVACPSCSPAYPTVHETIATSGGLLTVRCTECGHVHKEEPPDEQLVTRRVVISEDGESFSSTVEAPADEWIAVGEEFVAETDEAILGVRITAIEIGPEERVEEALVRDVSTIWTRAVDNVAVNVTIHPSDGSREGTRSTKVYLPGDYEFTVGTVEALGSEEIRIEGIVVREDASGYPSRKLDHAGDTVPAKDAKRVYGRDETTDAWSAW